MEFILETVLAPYGLTVERVDDHCNLFRVCGSRGHVNLFAYFEAGGGLTHKSFLRRPEFADLPVFCVPSEEVWRGEITTAALVDTDAVRKSGYLPFSAALTNLDEIAGRLISRFKL